MVVIAAPNRISKLLESGAGGVSAWASHGWDKVKTTLTTYKVKYKDCKVPVAFKVLTRWPR
jgi:hypothetical protein